MANLRSLKTMITKASKKYGFDKERFEVFHDADGTYGLDIDGDPWTNYEPADEIESELTCIFKGMEMLKGE